MRIGGKNDDKIPSATCVFIPPRTYSDVQLLQRKELMIHLDRPQQLLRAVHQFQGT